MVCPGKTITTYKVFTTGLRSGSHVGIAEICKIRVVHLDVSTSSVIQTFNLCPICYCQIVEEIIQLQISKHEYRQRHYLEAPDKDSYERLGTLRPRWPLSPHGNAP